MVLEQEVVTTRNVVAVQQHMNPIKFVGNAPRALPFFQLRPNSEPMPSIWNTYSFYRSLQQIPAALLLYLRPRSLKSPF